jgi:hypothetical protein
MRLNVKGALAATAAATIVLATVGLQPAEARRNHHHSYHRHHNGGQVILGTMAAMALIAASNQYANPYYGPYPNYPYAYGPEYPYWNGYTYGPAYGGPVYGWR